MNVATIERHPNEGSESWSLVILRVALAFVFIFAGINKFRDPATFEVSLIHWQLFPDALLNDLVWGIPSAEILGALACLSIRWRRSGLIFLLVLTAIYSLLLALEWARGISPGCGCFGSASAHWPYYALLLRNAGLIMVELSLINFSALQLLKFSMFSPTGGVVR